MMTDGQTLQERIFFIGNTSCRLSRHDYINCIPAIAQEREDLDVNSARALIRLISNLFKEECLRVGYEERAAQRIVTKFRDAGRRSAPWMATSSIVPGRPQDGADGNRTSRWLLPIDHKFHASEITATLVEVKYFLQAFSMGNAPDIRYLGFSELFSPWLLEHPISPNLYLDPIQLTIIDFQMFMNEPRSIQSGHIFPLDRGGRHHYHNTFLMLFRSNQLQGNLTVEELLQLMQTITASHEEARRQNSLLERRIAGFL